MIRRHLAKTLAQLGAPFIFSFDRSSRVLDAILVDFSDGIGCGFEGISGERLQALEQRIVWQRRSFFREGYAFALAARTALVDRRGHPEGRNRGIAPFRMMHYTGYGFWNGCAETMSAPRLAEDAAAWSGVEDYPLLYPFLVGGRSFGRLIRARSVTSGLIRSFENEGDPGLTEAAWHGVGRAFWFRAPGRPEALAGMIDAYAPARKPMLLGLGFAMTYTQIATPAAVLQTLGSMPPAWRHDLNVGAGVALAALIHELPEEEARVHSLYGNGELAPYLDDAVEAERNTARDGHWYAAFNAHLARATVHATAAAAS